MTDHERQEEKTLRENEASSRLLPEDVAQIEDAAQAFWETDASGVVVADSPGWRAYTGQSLEQWMSQGWTGAVHPDERARAEWHWRNVLTGRRQLNAEFRLLTPGGAYRWTNIRAAPVMGRNAAVQKWSGVGIDITERKSQEEQSRQFLREANHRSKNMLALILAIAHKMAAGWKDEFLDRFSKRVQALAASQDLLMKAGPEGVELADLVRSQLARFEGLIGMRIAISGPPLQISAAAAQTLGMAAHELAANASDYGALSNEKGRVDISWGVEPGEASEEVFSMSWIESGGPAVEAPSRKGFGSTVTRTLVEMNLRARSELAFAPSGLNWRMSCPVSKILEGRRRRKDVEAAPAKAESASRQSPRILVVEDEGLVALEIARILSEAGLQVAGPATGVAQALEIVKETGCDAAVLDINLGRETSAPVARMLRARGTPFITLSGYSRYQHPSEFDGVPALTKPVEPKLLVGTIKRCLKNSTP